MSAVFALVVAAGRGTRFGGDVPKQYLPLGGGTVLRHAAAAFARHPRIAGVQIVIRAEDRAIYDCGDRRAALLPPVPGGAGAAGFGAARAGGAGRRAVRTGC